MHTLSMFHRTDRETAPDTDQKHAGSRRLTGLLIGGLLGALALGACSEKTDAPKEDTTADVAAEETAPQMSFAEHVAETTARVNEARIVGADSEPGNWLAHGRTYSEQRYSPLDQINDQNVGTLGLAWSYDTATTRGLEASPIVVDGVMYFTGSWSTVYAVNAKTGEELWTFDPEVPRPWGRFACCDVVNRGVAVWEGMVFVGTIDGRLIALDAANGSELWDVMTIDQSKPYTITGAPRVVKGKVIIGNGGAELGVRGYFSAYDAKTGELAWRFYTVPGDPSKPFEHKELEVAAATWTTEGKYWEVGGGGTAWDSMAYDPALDLLYVGTGNGSPWNRYVRSPGGGDNLFLSSILALRPETGELVWHYQTTPGDSWDYTATQHIVLADMEWQGETRKILMQAPKNGFFYILDRETGELLSAEKYVNVTWASHVDMETGKPVEIPEADMKDQLQVIFPAPWGGHNWHPMSYSPDTGLVYIPAREYFGIYNTDKDFKQEPGEWNLGVNWAEYAAFLAAADGQPAPPQFGMLLAWDPKTQTKAWSIEQPNLVNGGILSTAGNLIFQGTGDGRFVAYSADTGTPLWAAPVQTGMIAPPITYSVDGEQYVAIMSGFGGIGITASVSPIAKYGNDGRMLVFKLGGGPLPALEAQESTIPEQPVIEATADELTNGGVQFAKYCMVCHGAYAISSGVAPDLRHMSAETHDIFNDIVRDGLYKENGMVGFGDWLTDQDAHDIHAYIVTRANLGRAVEDAAPQDEGAEMTPADDPAEETTEEPGGE